MLKRLSRIGAAAAVGGAMTIGGAAAAGAAPLPGSSGGDTPVLDCAHETATEPADIIIYCGDANGGFTDIDWYAWTDDVAVGTANRFYNDCDPACYSGTFHKEPVWIVLHDPQEPQLAGDAQDDTGPVFSAVTAFDPSGVHETPLPGFPWGEDSSFR